MRLTDEFPTGIRVGDFKSKFEDRIARQLSRYGVKPEYETYRIPYVIPTKTSMYSPDFLLPNGIFIEIKGLWTLKDRQKHLLIKSQYRTLDIRLVFSNSRKKISKCSLTSYADFCENNGIKFADKLIPKDWLKEKYRVIPPFIVKR